MIQLVVKEGMGGMTMREGSEGRWLTNAGNERKNAYINTDTDTELYIKQQ